MGNAFLHGAYGGTSLNFKIIHYATEETLLAATPAENAVGAVTAHKITSWIFSADAPAEPEEGMLWIAVGTGSAVGFNALKKNGIYLYPISCKQYVGGAWINVEAYVYQGGVWTKFSSLIEYLYNNGETPYAWQGSGTDSDIELVMEVIHGKYNGGYTDYGHKYATEPIVIPSGFTKLSIKYYCTGKEQKEGTPTNAFVLRTDYSENTYCTETNVVASVSIPYTTEEAVASMDITEALYGQSLYVGTYFHSHANVEYPKEYHIKEIWFE